MKLCPLCLHCYEDAETACARPGHGALVASRHGSRVIADKYRLDKLIGRGGMGAVYAGVHVELERPAAIKMLLPHFAADALVAERFKREARAAARLNHPNVAGTYDYGTLPDGESYIVMELVEGRTLTERLREAGALPFREAVSVARQAAQGVENAHRGGIVHRDLKPSNIILSQDHHDALLVKVLDFGIAKLKEYTTGAHDPITKTGSVVGTPRYMSPEQCSDHEVDARSDVYSLGVILYEMLAGHPPFEAPSAAALALKHIQEPPPPLRASRPDTPPALERLVAWALSKDPAARPQTAAEFARALGELDETLPREAADETRAAADPAAPYDTGRQTPVPTGADRYIAPDTGRSGTSTDSRTSPDTTEEARSLARDEARGHSLEDFRPPSPDTVAGLLRGDGQSLRASGDGRDGVGDGAEKLAPPPAPTPPEREVITRASVAPPRARRTGLHLAGVVGVLLVLLTGIVVVVLVTRRGGSSSSDSAKTVSRESAPAPAASPQQTATRDARPAGAEAEEASSPSSTPSPAVGPSRAGEAATLREALGGWVAATNARDIGGQLAYYAPRLDAFYTRRGVTREDVRAEKQGTFGSASRVAITVGEPSIETSADGLTSTMRFRKQYVIEAGAQKRSGAVLQELRWTKTGEGWRITSERDLQVIP